MRTFESLEKPSAGKYKLAMSALTVLSLVACGNNAEDSTVELPVAEFVDEGSINQAATATEQAERLSMSQPPTSADFTLLQGVRGNYINPQQLSGECFYSSDPRGVIKSQEVSITVTGLDPDSTPNDNSIDGGWITGKINDDLQVGGLLFQRFADENGIAGFGISGTYIDRPDITKDQLSNWSGNFEIYRNDAYSFDIPESEKPFAVYRVNLTDCVDVS